MPKDILADDLSPNSPVHENTPTASIFRSNNLIYHVDSSIMNSNIELQIDMGDKDHTKFLFQLVDGEISVRKITYAKGEEARIKISPTTSNIVYIK